MAIAAWCRELCIQCGWSGMCDTHTAATRLHASAVPLSGRDGLPNKNSIFRRETWWKTDTRPFSPTKAHATWFGKMHFRADKGLRLGMTETTSKQLEARR